MTHAQLSKLTDADLVERLKLATDPEERAAAAEETSSRLLQKRVQPGHETYAEVMLPLMTVPRSSSELAEAADVSTSTARKVLEPFVEAGHVIRTGKKRGTRYVLASHSPPSDG